MTKTSYINKKEIGFCWGDCDFCAWLTYKPFKAYWTICGFENKQVKLKRSDFHRESFWSKERVYFSIPIDSFFDFFKPTRKTTSIFGALYD